MARQSGIIKLKGTIGDITFYKSKDGYLTRQKGGVDKERFHNHPKFQRTRENAAEFARAGKASKALCPAIGPVLSKTQDSDRAKIMTICAAPVGQVDELSVVRGSVAEVAKELDVDPSLLSQWRRNPRYNVNKVLPDNSKISPKEQELRILRKRLRDAELEHDILKKAIAIFSKGDGPYSGEPQWILENVIEKIRKKRKGASEGIKRKLVGLIDIDPKEFT